MTHPPDSIANASLRAFVIRLGLFVVFWWALTDGSGGWGFGLPLALIVAAISLRISPASRHYPRASRLPAFIAYFMLQSLRAGWDVARRTLRPDMTLAPEILEIPLRLPGGAPTWWLMATISLLPGTLSVRIDHGRLELHCLDARDDVIDGIREAESRLGRLFALPPLEDCGGRP